MQRTWSASHLASPPISGFYRPAIAPEGLEGYGYQSRTYATNGQRIYYTGTNQRGERIPFRGTPPWLSMRGDCVSCHGEDGQGQVGIVGTSSSASEEETHEQRQDTRR